MAETSGGSSLKDAIEERKRAKAAAGGGSQARTERGTERPAGDAPDLVEAGPKPSVRSQPASPPQAAGAVSDHEARAGGAFAAIDAWGDLENGGDYANADALSGFPSGESEAAASDSGDRVAAASSMEAPGREPVRREAARPAREQAQGQSFQERDSTRRRGAGPAEPPSPTEESRRAAAERREALERREASERRAAAERKAQSSQASPPAKAGKPAVRRPGSARPGGLSVPGLPSWLPAQGVAVSAMAVLAGAATTPMAAALFVPFAGAAFTGRGWGSAVFPGVMLSVLASMWFFS